MTNINNHALPDDIREQARDAAIEIAGLPNVVMVTVGQKRVKGIRTGQRAFVAYVSRKENVAKADAVPKKGKLRRSAGKGSFLQTDVVPLLGKPRLLGVQAGDIIVSGDGTTWGTSCLTFTKGNRSYVSTNAHVVANLVSRSMPIADTAIQDPVSQILADAGPVVYVSPFPLGMATDEDFAVIWCANLQVDIASVLGLSTPIARFGSFSQAPNAAYWYATNGSFISCTNAEPHVGQPVGMTLGGTTILYDRFWALSVSQGSPEHGHSGSIVCRGSGADVEACGILFGGIGPNCALVFDLEPVYNKVLSILPD